ncbi:MAG: metalloregulator ArsR/SmtB family transcription factor [bacterium]|nr:metalloregulator ArsR/SmtB family transcription factor [bacterium]
MYEKVFRLHAQLLQALAHPKRLEILQLLRNKELSVSDIQTMLSLPQANLSQHLQILRAAGVVETRKNGKQIYYHLSHLNFAEASDRIREILIERHKDSPLADEFTTSMTDLVPLALDPVCGMRLSPKTASFAAKYNGRASYFCASRCHDRFLKHPEKYSQKDNQ